MHILLIAPSAPPKNSPEAMQVGRFLTALDPSVRVTLVTTPVVDGWARGDESLAVNRSGMKVIHARLPLHNLTQRVLGNHRLSALHVPDTGFWLPWTERQILAQIGERPDIIYSRSAPFSAALLARRLKQKLQIPWLMHLSDPWVGSPYRKHGSRASKKDRSFEANCFAAADGITFTTEGQAAYYRQRYPERTASIHVSPNMMPTTDIDPLPPKGGNCLRLVYTGAFYGSREPSTLLEAIHLLHEYSPKTAKQIVVEFYGNMHPNIAADVEMTPSCRWHGVVSFAEATIAQREAAILVAIEPAGKNPFLQHILLSKTVDYMAKRRPILAITPEGSETSKLCAEGFGWAVTPGEVKRLAALLEGLAHNYLRGVWQKDLPDLAASPYQAQTVTENISKLLTTLVDCHNCKEAEA
tara:strand:+ start:5225 stop:6460 length:1236 start_codon:yes stop_codon:yes gene_type:complete